MEASLKDKISQLDKELGELKKELREKNGLIEDIQAKLSEQEKIAV